MGHTLLILFLRISGHKYSGRGIVQWKLFADQPGQVWRPRREHLTNTRLPPISHKSYSAYLQSLLHDFCPRIVSMLPTNPYLSPCKVAMGKLWHFSETWLAGADVGSCDTESCGRGDASGHPPCSSAWEGGDD